MATTEIKLFISYRMLLHLAFRLVLFLLLPLTTAAQQQADDEEVSVYFNMQQIGHTEISCLIRNDIAYLPVAEIFDFLKIANKTSLNRDSISGFFISQSAIFLIDNARKLILYQGKIFPLKSGDLIKTPSNLYLKSNYFGDVFGLHSIFSYRNLSVTMSTDFELPFLRDLRLSEMRANLGRLKGEVKADTTIKRSYPAFHFGTADWSLINMYDKQVGTDVRASLRLGGIVAGGETDVAINYHSTEPLVTRNQYYRWRLADNDNTIVRQLTAGMIPVQSISSIFAPVIGMQVTNTPTTFRRSFGTYTISNTTQPNWVVELYINNVLVNYVKADAAGFYSFDVPLIYGSSLVKLRFYGPAGEETFSEENINIPFTFLPAKEFQYTASAGFLEDGSGSRFARLSADYGLSSFLTAGGGTEYLSSVTSGRTIPFINSSARILPNLLASAEHAFGVRTKALLTYKFASGLQVELNDTWYKAGQTAINNTFKEERKAILSLPFRGKNFSAYTRLTISQMILPVTRYSTAEWLVSGVAWNINGNINTFSLFSEGSDPYIYSNFSLSSRVLKRYLFTQHVLYAYSNSQITGYKEELERKIFSNGYLRLSYENNIQSNIKNFEVGLRYDFQFAQTGTSVRAGNNTQNILQFASGSLVLDKAAGYTAFDNHSNVGRGGIVIVPFLDLNFNDKKDSGEPRAYGLRLKSSRSGIYTVHAKDTTLRVTQLEPYVNYILELDPAGFENVAWQLDQKNYSIAVDPNIIRTVNVPVHIMGEAAGNVNIQDREGAKGLGRIVVQIYQQSKLVASTLTESDGYFSYLGLKPGTYTASVDTAQLRKLNLTSQPAALKIEMKMSTEGSVTDGLTFLLSPRTASSAESKYASAVQAVPGFQPDVPVLPLKVPVRYTTTTSGGANKHKTIAKEDKFVQSSEVPAAAANQAMLAEASSDSHHARFGITVQAAHFRIKNALLSKAYLISRFGYDCFILPTGRRQYYNVYITGLRDIVAAKVVLARIKFRGFPDAYVLPGVDPLP